MNRLGTLSYGKQRKGNIWPEEEGAGTRRMEGTMYQMEPVLGNSPASRGLTVTLAGRTNPP